jgi:hypothetical protein
MRASAGHFSSFVFLTLSFIYRKDFILGQNNNSDETDVLK